MKSLIIKISDSSFEKKVNEWFVEAGCELITIEELTKGYTGWCKIREICNRIKVGEFKKYEKVIVFDDFVVFSCFHYLLSKDNVFLWYWNTIRETLKDQIVGRLSGMIGNSYTFDFGDAKKYSLKTNTQFLGRVDIEEKKNEYDLYFIGNDKGRYEYIDRMYSFCSNNMIRCLIQIVADNSKQYNNMDIIIHNAIEYSEILKNISTSKAVLDICKEGQTGPTIRAMEAILYGKKIVTNNEEYRRLPFYSDDNVFILNDLNMADVKDFINGNNAYYTRDLLDYYNINSWTRRFVKY